MSPHDMNVLIWLTAENSWWRQHEIHRLDDVLVTADQAFNLAIELDRQFDDISLRFVRAMNGLEEDTDDES